MDRPLTVILPDGGQTSIDYHGDALPLKVTKTVLATPSPSIVTSTVYDPLGRGSQRRLDSDPAGIDYTDTTYDALKQIGYLLLDEALGEYDVESRLGLIKMLSPEARTEETRYPLFDLPARFDRLISLLGKEHRT